MVKVGELEELIPWHPGEDLVEEDLQGQGEGDGEPEDADLLDLRRDVRVPAPLAVVKPQEEVGLVCRDDEAEEVPCRSRDG